MGTKHIATNSNFTNYYGFTGYPLKDPVYALTDLYYLGVDQATSVVNQAGGTNLTVTGTPTYTATSATCTSSAVFLTNTLDTANDTTLCGVFTPILTSPGGVIVGNLAGALTSHFALWTANNTALNIAGGGSVDNTTSANLGSATKVFAAAGFIGTTKFIATGINDTISVSAASIHKVGLSLEQIQALYDYFRWYYSTKGVVVA